MRKKKQAVVLVFVSARWTPRRCDRRAPGNVEAWGRGYAVPCSDWFATLCYHIHADCPTPKTFLQ
jgi:hypothetical protein